MPAPNPVGANGLILALADAQAQIPALAALPSALQAGIVNAATDALCSMGGWIYPLCQYDELARPENTRVIYLRQKPIWDVQLLATGLASVFTVIYQSGSSSLQRAGVQLNAGTQGNGYRQPASMTLWRQSAGVAVIEGPYLFATYPTLSALAAVINSNTGWTATYPSGFDQWACADLNLDLGRKGCAGTNAAFWSFTRQLTNYEVDYQTGQVQLHEDLYQAHRFPDRTWPASGPYGAVRLIYQAGYNTDAATGPVTMPDKLVQAALILCQVLADKLDAGLIKSEKVGQNAQTLFDVALGLKPFVQDLIGRETNCRLY